MSGLKTFLLVIDLPCESNISMIASLALSTAGESLEIKYLLKDTEIYLHLLSVVILWLPIRSLQ